MAFMTESERVLARAIADLAGSNPFLPEWIEAEQRVLGPDFIATGLVWHARPVAPDRNPNLDALYARIESLGESLRARLAAGTEAGPHRALYEQIALSVLYKRIEPDLLSLILDGDGLRGRVACWPRFERDVRHFLDLPALGIPAPDPAHLFAFLFQVRRAFYFTMEHILGGSLAAARLRASVWQSIFTHDIDCYRRALTVRLQDATTLIVGPSGTGKELVAQALARSRYLPFDPKEQRFAEDFRGAYHALHLAAPSPTLIESELFGHKKGAFTGAVADRPSWLEQCSPHGTVFLDEIAEIDPAIQVKLLRVLETRAFQRVGDTRERRFHGKVIAATNRDLAAEIEAGRFRPDLYYRLCSDVIDTPALEAQLRDAPEELGHFLRFIAPRVAGEAEAGALAERAEAWITKHLGRDYRWPGNVRELEQCVRNVLIRGEYQPPRRAVPGLRDELAGAFLAGVLTADEFLRRYCTLVLAQTGSYVETARRLGIDRRTVKKKVDPALVEMLRSEPRAAM